MVGPQPCHSLLGALAQVTPPLCLSSCRMLMTSVGVRVVVRLTGVDTFQMLTFVPGAQVYQVGAVAVRRRVLSPWPAGDEAWSTLQGDETWRKCRTLWTSVFSQVAVSSE